MIRVSSQEFDCTGHGEGYYENPNSCSSFYICAAGVTFKSDCHPGLLYSRASGYCDFPDHVTCHSNNLTLAPIIAQRPVVKTNASPAASGKLYSYPYIVLKRNVYSATQINRASQACLLVTRFTFSEKEKKLLNYEYV